MESDRRVGSFDAVVVNVAGPHSYLVDRMAGVYDSMNIKTRALRHEVHYAPGPSTYDYERDGFNITDDDNGICFRPENGNHILVDSTDPLCDPQLQLFSLAGHIEQGLGIRPAVVDVLSPG